jgi:hypothetical protein
MPDRNIFFILTLTVFITARTLSQGGPPMITDDPYPVEKNHMEINLGLTGEFLNLTQIYEIPLVDCNYGINDRMHLKFEAPILMNHQNGGSEAGLGKSSIGVKWLIYENKKSEFGFGIFPAVDFNISNSSVERGLSERGVQFILPVSFMKTIGKSDIVLQIGRVFSSGDNGEWHYGFLAGFTVSRKVETAIELTGNLRPDITEHSSFLNVGLRFGLNKTITLLFSGGRQIISPEGEEKSTIVFVGTKLFF